MAGGPRPAGSTGALYAGHAGGQLQKFVGEFETAVTSLGPIPGSEYPALFDEALSGVAIHPRTSAHPRLSILGALDARLVSADRMIAGGLVEGSWPRRAAPSPWLSRNMQAALKLLTDAHRAGMGAHDFVDAASVPEAYLCFARKARGYPTVRSRWLTRLNTVLRSAGRTLPAPAALGQWQQLTAPPAYRPLPRPSFAPPVSARPRRLSVTQVRTLAEEPYATYARHVLGLRALDRPGRRPGLAEFGNAVHEALERFTREFGGSDLPDDAEQRLHALGAEGARPVPAGGPWRRAVVGALHVDAPSRGHRAVVSPAGAPPQDGSRCRLGGDLGRAHVRRSSLHACRPAPTASRSTAPRGR